MTTIAISFIIFTAWLIFIRLAFGKLDSISESFYKLSEKHRFIFTLVLWGFSLPLMVNVNSVWLFLSISGIAFVGAAAAYKEELTSTVHFVGAVGGIIMGLVYLLTQWLFWLALPSILVSVSLYFLSKRPTYWIEIVSYYTILIGLIYLQLV